MKKLYFIFAFLTLGLSATAANSSVYNPYRGDAIIFVERGVEFAVFPDGQFDFFFNPRGNFNRIPAHINYSFNSGYNYGPFIQYDDYGAVIQIENVPVYYDYYGRLIQAGRVRIGYNNFGMVDRIGNMFLHYNFYNQLTHTSGFINSRNASYVYRPWHDHYMRPNNYSVVYNEPYRLYYVPNRMKYSHYRRYYDTYYSTNNFQQGYYTPGQRVTSYQRGRRDSSPREISTPLPSQITATPTRKIRIQDDVREVPAQRAQVPTRTSRIDAPVVRQNTEMQSRSSRVEVPARNTEVQSRNSGERTTLPTVESRVKTRTRSTRTESPAVQRNIPQQSRTSSPVREVETSSRRTEVSPAATTAPEVRTSSSPATRGPRSSRGQ